MPVLEEHKFRDFSPFLLFYCMFLFAIPLMAEADTTPPVIESITFSTSVVDSTTGTQNVTVTARITDDISGVRYGVLYISSPSGAVTQYVFFSNEVDNGFNRISGDGNDGIYETSIQIPQYTESGTWSISELSVRDNEGNTEFVDNPPQFSSQTLLVTSAGYDTTLPVLESLSLSSSNIDTTTGPQIVTVTAGFSDDISGILGASVRLSSPSGDITESYGFGSPVSGSELDGVYEANIEISQFSESGVWTISSVFVRDIANNSGYLDISNFSNTAITVTSAGFDDTAPVIESLSFNPNPVDTTTGEQLVTITVRISDDLSGLDSAHLNIADPDRNIIFSSSFSDSNRISGNANDGFYEDSFTIPQFASSGDWTISYLFTQDNSSNSYQSIDPVEFTSIVLNVSSADNDTTPPVIESITITPDTIDTSSGQQTVTVTTRITDDLSGFNYGKIDISSPNDDHAIDFFISDFNRVTGDALDGIYEDTFVIPQFIESGDWRVSYVSAHDQSLNEYYESEPMDFISIILSVTSPGNDVTAPVIESINFSPNPVDTVEGEELVTVTARITDDLSGFESGNIVISSPGNTEEEFIYLSDFHRISGNALDGIYEYSFLIPQYTESGDWRISSISTRDQSSNDDFVSEPPEFASTLLSVMSPANDVTPPAIHNISLTPDSVDTHTGEQTIILTAHITDDISGLHDASIAFQSPDTFSSINFPIDSSKLISGNINDGIYEISLHIPQYIQSGVWTISHIYLNDNSSNSVNPQNLADFSDVTLTIVSPGSDISSPVLESFSISSNSVDSSNGEQLLTVTARITDDLSGVDNLVVSYSSPSGQKILRIQFDETNRISGDALDGMYETTMVIPQYIESGIWSINYIFAFDMTSSAFIPFFPYHIDIAPFVSNSIAVSASTDDPVSPVLESISMNPNTVDVSSGEKISTVTFRVTDNLSGFREAAMRLSSPAGVESIEIIIDASMLISGDVLDGVYAGDFVIPQGAFTGTWVIDGIRILDNSFNPLYIPTASLDQNAISVEVSSETAHQIPLPIGVLIVLVLIFIRLNATENRHIYN